MNLLPKSYAEFSSEDYWNKFFSKRGSHAFEWYGEYPQLCEFLFKYLRPKDTFLVIGCGNSSLSADLYDSGYTNSVSIDISDIVIHQMTKKYANDRPGMVYQKMDMLETSFKDGSFNAILDKGTLDALMTDDSEESRQRVDKMFMEISRLLKQGGRYICVSLLQQHILKKILDWFCKEGWMVRVQRCIDAEENNESREVSMVFPVFMVICTKLNKLPGINTILELSLTRDSTFERINSIEEFSHSVQSVQYYAMLKHNLNTRNMANDIVKVELYTPSSPHPRYTLFVIDSLHSQSGKKFAIFITPQGRETEWLFGMPQGQKHLAKNAQFQRLIIVHLNRNHIYKGMEEVKAELSSKVMDLAPKGLNPHVEVPFLSVGDDVGKRNVNYKGNSKFSGEFVVEDVLSDGQLFRRLIFLNNQMLIQTEAKLKLGITKVRGMDNCPFGFRVSAGKKKKKQAGETIIDHSYLACSHHAFMVSGFSFIAPKGTEQEAKALLIGLGGGSLATYILNYLRKVSLIAVDIDQSVVDVAVQWFDLKAHDRLNIEVDDGLNVIKQRVDQGCHYDAVLLDVDSKDSSIGMTCPPPAFVSKDTLQQLSTLVQPSGVVILNLVCRDETLKASVYDSLTSTFATVFKIPIPDEVNEVVFALPSDNFCDGESIPMELNSQLNKLVKQIRSQTRTDVVDVAEMMKSLQIVSPSKDR